MMESLAKVRLMFFTSAAVIASTGKATRKVLSKFGSYVRQTAKQSLRYRKRASDPGQPPSVHRSDQFVRTTKSGKQRATSPLKELIYFVYEPTKKNVVIGPIAFGGPVGIVPPTLEYGGSIGGRINRRRRLRTLGGAGEVRIGGPMSRSTKRNKDGKLVTYAKLMTPAQVTHANHLNEVLYGPMELPPATIEARPFMRPAFSINQTKLPAMWAGAVK